MGRRPDDVGCDEFRRTLRLDRRGFLKAGVLGASGMALGDLLRFEASRSARGDSTRAAGGRPPSVILLWMRGGPSHIDMWDPKPDAPGGVPGRVRHDPDRGARHLPDRHAPDERGGDGPLVDRPEPAPRRRRPLHRRPDLLHRLPGRSGPRPERDAQLRLGRGEAARPPEPAPARLRDDPEDGTRDRARRTSASPTSRSRPCADPAAPGALPRAELRASRRGHPRPGRRPPRPAGELRPAPPRPRRLGAARGDRPLRPACLGRPDLARRRATPSTSTGKTRGSASVTDSCPPSTPAPSTAAARPPGASASCWPAGWSRRASGS